MKQLVYLLRGLIKLFLFVVIIGGYMVVALVVRNFLGNSTRRRRFYVPVVSATCKLILFLMRAKVNIKETAYKKDQHYLYVGNHLGMLDIIILAAARPTLFITSVDMRETPGLGLLTEVGGCLYVERRNRSNIANEINEIRETLKQGFSVVLFAEGVATNGERVLPFKKSLMTSVAGINVPIKPFVLNFRKVNGETMSHKWRDFVFWYGDQKFHEALWRIFSLNSIEVDLEFFPEVQVHSEEERREVAIQIQKQIESKYTPIPMPQEESTFETHLQTASSNS